MPTHIDINSAIIIASALLVGLFTLIRGRADVWKSNYEGEKTRADDLFKKHQDLTTENTALKERVAKLEALPNLEKLFQLIEHHDANTQKQAKAVIASLDAIAKKLA